MRRWWKSRSKRIQEQRCAAAARWNTTAPAGAQPAQRTRQEVCPPSLLAEHADAGAGKISSLLPPLTSVMRWLQTGWYSTDPDAARRKPLSAPQRSAFDEQLQQARAAFLHVIADLRPPAATELAQRVRAAPSLRELWHLRNALFTRISIDHCESVAMARLSGLNRHFAVRDHAPRPHRRFGSRTDGFDPHRPAP